jgi:hypothetical protein
MHSPARSERLSARHSPPRSGRNFADDERERKARAAPVHAARSGAATATYGEDDGYALPYAHEIEEYALDDEVEVHMRRFRAAYAEARAERRSKEGPTRRSRERPSRGSDEVPHHLRETVEGVYAEEHRDGPYPSRKTAEGSHPEKSEQRWDEHDEQWDGPRQPRHSRRSVESFHAEQSEDDEADGDGEDGASGWLRPLDDSYYHGGLPASDVTQSQPQSHVALMTTQATNDSSSAPRARQDIDKRSPTQYL